MDSSDDEIGMDGGQRVLLENPEASPQDAAKLRSDPFSPYYPGRLGKGTPVLRHDCRSSVQFLADPLPIELKCLTDGTSSPGPVPPARATSSAPGVQAPPAVIENLLALANNQGTTLTEAEIHTWFSEFNLPRRDLEAQMKKLLRSSGSITSAVSHYQRADSLCGGRYPATFTSDSRPAAAASTAGPASASVDEIVLVDQPSGDIVASPARLSLYRIPESIVQERILRGKYGEASVSPACDIKMLDVYRRAIGSKRANVEPLEDLASVFDAPSAAIELRASSEIPPFVFSVDRSSCGRFVAVCCNASQFSNGRVCVYAVVRGGQGGPGPGAAAQGTLPDRLDLIGDIEFSDPSQMINGLRFCPIAGKERIVVCSQMSEQRGLVYIFNVPTLTGAASASDASASTPRYDALSLACDAVSDLRIPEALGLRNCERLAALGGDKLSLTIQEVGPAGEVPPGKTPVFMTAAIGPFTRTANFAVSSPDGRHLCIITDGDLAYILSHEDGFEPTAPGALLKFRRLGYQPLAGTGGLYCSWSPDSRRLAITSDRLMAVFVIDAERKRHVATIACPRAPLPVSFVPWDSDVLCFAMEHGFTALVVLPSVTPPDEPEALGGDREGDSGEAGTASLHHPAFTVQLQYQHQDGAETDAGDGDFESGSDSNEGDEEGDAAAAGLVVGETGARVLGAQRHPLLIPPSRRNRSSMGGYLARPSSEWFADQPEQPPFSFFRPHVQILGHCLGLTPREFLPQASRLDILQRTIEEKSLFHYHMTRSHTTGLALLPSGMLLVSTCGSLMAFPMPAPSNMHLGYIQGLSGGLPSASGAEAAASEMGLAPSEHFLRPISSRLHPAFRRAAQIVLLAASAPPAAGADDSDTMASSNPQGDSEGRLGSATEVDGAGSSGAAPHASLSDLPRDLVLEVLARAAFPVSAWSRTAC